MFDNKFIAITFTCAFIIGLISNFSYFSNFHFLNDISILLYLPFVMQMASRRKSKGKKYYFVFYILVIIILFISLRNLLNIII